jgi:Fe-Mn family superoxide dismutase
MVYSPKKFDHLLGLAGLSDILLNNHFALYSGYVTNFNKLDETLMLLEKEGKFGTPEFAEMNRRLGWEYNGMRLHELYFENLTKIPSTISSSSKLNSLISKEWGSFENWEKDFRAMAAMRGIGWVILYYDKSSDRLFNVWVNEHDTGHFAGCVPLIVIDVFEHAFMIDYGLKRADYVAVLMKSINWIEVEKRFNES